jgi:hypothetical protein
MNFDLDLFDFEKGFCFGWRGPFVVFSFVLLEEPCTVKYITVVITI